MQQNQQQQPFQFQQPPMGGNFGQNPMQGGMQPMMQGYNQALQQLQKSLNLSGQTTQAGQMQLGQQLHQQQGQVQQNLTNRGLGNTTVANSMQQQPMQTYNLGMAQLNDLGNQRQMQGYDALANAAMQGGQGMSQYMAPYAQSQYIQQQQGAQQQQQAQQNPNYNNAYSQMQRFMPGLSPDQLRMANAM